jgi:hypothetical protein
VDEKKRELEQSELEETNGEEPPDREVMSTIPLDRTGFPPIVPPAKSSNSKAESSFP